MHHSGLTGTDRLLGVGFGTIRGIFVVALIMVVIRLSAFPEEEYRKQSVLYNYFTPAVNWLYQNTPNLLKRVEDLEHQTKPTREKHTDITVRDFQSL
jgi:membrane protein required for colicin V production